MQKKLTITLDQDVYDRLCIVVGSYDGKSCSHFIEKWVQGRVANCYAPGELDTLYSEQGQEAAFQARMNARNKATFADEALEAEFQDWLTEQYRLSEEDRQLENKFLDRLEADFRAEYEDPEMEAEFRKWLVEGRLWIMDDKLQKEAEDWAWSLTANGQPIVVGDALSESR